MNLQQLTRVVSDGTGLTKEEIWLFGTLAAVVAMFSGLLRVVEAVSRLLYDLGDG